MLIAGECYINNMYEINACYLLCIECIAIIINLVVKPANFSMKNLTDYLREFQID